MYKIKCFRAIVAVLLFWTISLCNSMLTSSIKSREIFHDGEIVSINSHLEGGAMSMDTLKSKHPSLVYTSIKCKYADTIVELLQTFFEIFVYGANAPTEIHVPNIKNHTRNWLVSAVDHFNGVKPMVAKMIDDLFMYSDKVSILRISDQSLLKSLLSINLFLHHSVNDKPFIVYGRTTRNDQSVMSDNDLTKTIKNVRLLNTSIVQMIGLVERFRSKRCVVRDPFKYNFVVNESFKTVLIHDVENIKSLLEPFLRRLNVLVNDGSDNYDGFNSELYDPEYLLFGNLLDHNDSFLENIKINWKGKKSALRSKYNDVKSAYSVESVLKFQQTLVSAIAGVFYVQIYNLSENSRDAVTKLADLHYSFEEYTNKMLPSNCSMSVCNKILKARVFFNETLKSLDLPTDSNVSDVLAVLKNRFEPVKDLDFITRKIQKEFAIDPSLFRLVDNIWRDAQYKSFRRVFKLLSYESHTNSEFHIVKVSDRKAITSSQSYDTTLFNRMIELQYALLAFSLLTKTAGNHRNVSNDIVRYPAVELSDLSAVGFAIPTNNTGKNKNYYSPEMQCGESDEYVPIFADMLGVVVKLYKLLDDEPDVKDVLLPLLIRFRHTDMFSCRISKYERLTMSQISFLTVTIVENYLINNYSVAFYNLFLYSKFIVSDKKGTDLSKLRRDLQTFAEASTTNFLDTLAFLNYLYDVDSYDAFFSEDDKQIRFLWNGSKQTGYGVYRSVVKGVSDFNDLIGLQWFGVKLFASKILVKIMNALILLGSKNATEDIFNSVKIKLKKILKLESPMPVKIFLDDIVNAILATLNVRWTDFNYAVFDQWKHLYHTSLIALDTHSTGQLRAGSEIEEINRAIDSEIEKYEKFASLNFLGTQNVLTSTDLSVSPVEEAISDKIFKMLYY